MYRAILFSTDGDYTFDYNGSKTISEVEELLANKGSKWYFYPFEFVVVDHPHNSDIYDIHRQRIVSVPMWPPELEQLKGKSVKTARDYIRKHGTRIAQYF